jgi:hypothetical protein
MEHIRLLKGPENVSGEGILRFLIPEAAGVVLEWGVDDPIRYEICTDDIHEFRHVGDNGEEKREGSHCIGSEWRTIWPCTPAESRCCEES